MARTKNDQHRRAVDATKGPLDATELADAAIAAALVFAILAIGRLLAAGTFFQVLGTVVFAVLAARHRTRTVVLAVVSTVLFTVLLGGTGPITQSAVGGLFGWAGGTSLARGYSRFKTIGLSLLVGFPPVAMASLAFFWLADELRELTFENVRNQWKGIGRIFDLVNASSAHDSGTEIIESIIGWWPVALPVTQFFISIVYALIVRRLSRRVLRGVNDALGPVVPMDLELSNATEGPVAPVPLAIDGAPIRRGDYVVNESVTLAVGEDEHVAISGRNGSGKSTLLDTLAGFGADDDIERTGRPGLGEVGGLAYVSQRPEGQVLAPTVSEDIRWGAPDDVDVEAALASVGLAGFGDRLTSELSGGEQQRLALASALARQPKLLLADEITSMLDPEGRAQINALVRDINESGVAVVRTSHLAADLDEADRVVTIGEPQRPESQGLLNTNFVGRMLLTATDVSFVYDRGKPWAHEVLSDVDLTIRSGELVLITGSNGSGKSTLARIIVGLASPTSGTVELGEEVHRAIAFQHARLQLLRPTVEQELNSLAGAHNQTPQGIERGQRIASAMRSLGISHLGKTRVDTLSGGQQRRVLIAGLLARGTTLLVLDEPLAGLDDEGRVQLTDVVDQLRREGTAVVVVSHDPTWGHDRVDQHLHLVQGRLTDGVNLTSTEVPSE